MTINTKQILSITLVILGVLAASTAQLNELLGPSVTKAVVSTATLVMSILAGIQGVISSQGNLVMDVQAMPGIEKISVNSKANPTLAALAVDPLNTKVAPTPEAAASVQATAQNA